MPLRNPELTRRRFNTLVASFVGTAFLGIAPKGRPSLDEWRNYAPPTGPDRNNCLVYTDTHLGFFGDDKPRLATSSTEAAMEESVHHLKDLPFDVVAHMGDMIEDSASRELNREKFQKMLAFLQLFPQLIAPMLGNHDRWGLTENDIQTVTAQRDFAQSFSGVIPLNNSDTQLVYLDTHAKKGRNGFVPDETLAMVEQNVYADTPTILMGHYSPVPFESTAGHPYPRVNPAFTNWQDLMELLRGKPIRAIFHGHTHLLHQTTYAYLDRTNQRPISVIGLPAFSENLVSTQAQYNPGVYTMLELTKQQIDVKVAHRGTIFAQVQVNG